MALSSGEAELYATNRGLSRFLGLVNLLREVTHKDFGVGCLSHYPDASATKSMVLRDGLATIKHLHLRDLWFQEAVKRYAITVEKISREANPADLLASPSSRNDMVKFLRLLGVPAGH